MQSSINKEITKLSHDMIFVAEEFLGLMTNDWNYIGVEFSDHPPHLFYYPETGDISISLSYKAMADEAQLIFQLAHEVCHLFYPTMRKGSSNFSGATVFNEGISTYFQINILQQTHGGEFAGIVLENMKTSSPKYYNSRELVTELLTIDQLAIKKIREVQPFINDVTLSDFEKARVFIDAKLAQKIIAKF